MRTLNFKNKFSLIVIGLLYFFFLFVVLGVSKLYYLTDLELVSYLGNPDRFENLEMQKVIVERLPWLLAYSGFAGFAGLLIALGLSIFMLYKRGFHWLHSLCALLLFFGLTLYNKFTPGWKMNISYWEVPGHLFNSYSFLYYLINGFLFIGLATLAFYCCLHYIKRITFRESSPNTSLLP